MVVVCPSATGAGNMRPCCSEWRSAREQAGEQLMVSLGTEKVLPLVLMFPSVLTVDDVCHVYRQCVFSKSVNDLQCSSLRQKKVYVCV